jgi:tetratricopeptide (TPR) repeat protein
MTEVRIATITAICLNAIFVVGCMQPVGKEGQELLRKANQSYESGQNQQTMELTTAFLKKYETTQPAGEAYYLRGLAGMRSNETSEAKKDFLKAVDKTWREDLPRYVKVALGNLAFEAENYDEAINYYRSALPDRPTKSPFDQAMFRLGVSLQRVGEWDEADDVFARLLYLFKGTPSAGTIRRFDLIGRDCYIIQVGAFGDSSNARKQTSRLRAAKINTSRKNKFEHGQRLIINYVGEFDDYSQAKKKLGVVKRHVSDAFIVPSTK